jgi:uncharacterized membrane protein YhaH (DUF805 family)
VGGSTSIEIEGYHPEFVPDFGVLFWILGGIVAVTVVLLAAAVARRLHDRGRSAFWGLAPLPFLAFGLTVMPMMMSEVVIGVGEPDMRLFFAIFLNNICYLAVLLTLIIQLSGAGQPEAKTPRPDARRTDAGPLRLRRRHPAGEGAAVGQPLRPRLRARCLAGQGMDRLAGSGTCRRTSPWRPSRCRPP